MPAQSHDRARTGTRSPRQAGHGGDAIILISCPSGFEGLARFSDDTGAEADYIAVEMARALLGPVWLPRFLERSDRGGIERVLL